jgi:hypothetical protein
LGYLSTSETHRNVASGKELVHEKDTSVSTSWCIRWNLICNIQSECDARSEHVTQFMCLPSDKQKENGANVCLNLQEELETDPQFLSRSTV